MDETWFDIHSRGKRLRDRSLLKIYSFERAQLACGLKRSEGTIFFSEIPNELCDRVYLIIQEKQVGNDTTRFDNEIVSRLDKILEYKRNTPTQHENINKKIFFHKILFFYFFRCDFVR